MVFRWRSLLLFALFGPTTCIDPVAPDYNYLSGFVFIEGEVTDKPGETAVRISESVLSFGQYSFSPISGASVRVIETGGPELTLAETPAESGTYKAPSGFAGQTGNEYRLEIVFPDGRQYLSTPEMLPKAVELDTIIPDFDPEYEYNDKKKEFHGAHRIRGEWQDPPGEKNYYEWRFLVYKKALFCASCFGGIYRNGECQPVASLSASNRYDYLCSEPCWTISPGESVNVFSDEFVDGNRVTGREVAVLPFESRYPALVLVSQYSITLDHYRFKLLLQNLSAETGGLNATPPAAIIGNIVNPNDPEEKVLGYFGASANRSKYVYIDRVNTPGTPFGGYTPNFEPPPPPPASTPTAPCMETETRTGIKPEGWPN